MSRVLDEAIARQRERREKESGGVICARAALAAAASRRLAIAMSRPMGLAVLEFCDAHPELVGRHGRLVDALRWALERREMIQDRIGAIWDDIPETMTVRPPLPPPVRP